MGARNLIPLAMAAPLPLTGLTADRFRHPFDLAATAKLRQLPGLDLLVRNLLGSVAAEVMYLNNIAAAVQLSDRQLPHIYQLLIDASRILDLEPPQLYLKQHPAPNAYTMAMRGQKPFVVIHTSLVELLNPGELQAVLAHELGHLKCEHGVYLTLANILAMTAGAILPGLGEGLQRQMLEWSRCAEFSCDRAALLVAQDPKVVASVLMKLCGGSPSLSPLLDVEAFLAQARAYKSVAQSAWGTGLQNLQTEPLTHPLPVLRAQEIDRWAQTAEYFSLLKGATPGYDDQAEKKGGWRNW
jgi:Zn-dependent protease with chaperone function